jgi:hypothetical protein
MSLTLNLDPALEQRLLLEAQISGLPLETWLAQDLKSRFQTDVTETVLLQRISLGLPESFWLAYRALLKKRDSQTLTVTEQKELIAMSDQTEELTLQRTQSLLELARRRNTTLEALRLQFGLHPVSVQS